MIKINDISQTYVGTYTYCTEMAKILNLKNYKYGYLP